MKTIREWVMMAAENSGITDEQIEYAMSKADSKHLAGSILSHMQIPDEIGILLMDAGKEILTGNRKKGLKDVDSVLEKMRTNIFQDE